MSDVSNHSPLAQLAAPPVFVIGAHRSGTTWVYDLLSSHPEVAGVFESGLFSSDLGLAPLLHPVHWYRDETQLAHDRAFFGKSFRLSQLLTREEALADIRQLAARWLGQALSQKHRYLVEKTPQHVHVIPFIAELFPNACFVHVLRDGRDVAVSVREAARSWPRGRIKAATIAGSATSWAAAVRSARSHSQAPGLRFVEVRYEDLHRDTGAELDRLLSACGIPAGEDLSAQISRSSEFKRRAGEASDAFRRAGRVGDWRSALGLRDRLEFERIAGDVLRDTGYESGRWWWLPKLDSAGS